MTVFDENGDPVADNDWGTANSLIDNPYLFTGRRFDEETGLMYYRNRYYDAGQGRFVGRDPIFPFNYVLRYPFPSQERARLNSYEYVIGSPTRLIDFDGLIPHDPDIHGEYPNPGPNPPIGPNAPKPSTITWLGRKLISDDKWKQVYGNYNCFQHALNGQPPTDKLWLWIYSGSNGGWTKIPECEEAKTWIKTQGYVETTDRRCPLDEDKKKVALYCRGTVNPAKPVTHILGEKKIEQVGNITIHHNKWIPSKKKAAVHVACCQCEVKNYYTQPSTFERLWTSKLGYQGTLVHHMLPEIEDRGQNLFMGKVEQVYEKKKSTGRSHRLVDTVLKVKRLQLEF